MRELKAIDPSTAIVVLTGYGSIATALESVRLGAVHYLTKPTDADRILAAFEHGLAARPRDLPIDTPSLARVEWEHIQRVLADCDGNVSEAARAARDASPLAAAQAVEVSGRAVGQRSRRIEDGQDHQPQGIVRDRQQQQDGNGGMAPEKIIRATIAENAISVAHRMATHGPRQRPDPRRERDEDQAGASVPPTCARCGSVRSSAIGLLTLAPRPTCSTPRPCRRLAGGCRGVLRTAAAPASECRARMALSAGCAALHAGVASGDDDGAPPGPAFNTSIAIWGSMCAVLAMFFFGREMGRRERAEAERDRLLTSERDARSEAERASRIKDDFMATLSHELRSPLAAMLGWCAIARKERLSPGVARAVETIERNARMQARLVDDLLDATRMQAGALQLELAPVALDGPVRAAIEGVRPAAEAKGLTLRYECGEPPAVVLGDASRLQQIASNLLVNAVKFTPEGKTIDVRVTSTGDHAELTVVDDGIGIDKAFMPHLFERFRQADSGAARQHGGLGLGLSIVANLVHLHHGDVDAASDGLGKGASFRVRLPASQDAAVVTSPSRALNSKHIEWIEQVTQCENIRQRSTVWSNNIDNKPEELVNGRHD